MLFMYRDLVLLDKQKYIGINFIIIYKGCIQM